MKTIEELRELYANTVQEGWGAEWEVRLTGYEGSIYAVMASYEGGLQPVAFVEAKPRGYRANLAFIVAAHNEFPAVLDEIERLRARNREWEAVFGHLADTPDGCGNVVLAKYDEYEETISRLKAEIRGLETASADQRI